MRDPWTDRHALDEADYTPAPGRNPDSSVAAQYEDSVPPDPANYSDGEEYEPS